MNQNGEKVSLQWLLHLILGISGFLICTVGALAIYIFTQTQGQVHDLSIEVNDLYVRVQQTKDDQSTLKYQVGEHADSIKLSQDAHDSDLVAIQALEKQADVNALRIGVLEKQMQVLPDLQSQVSIDHQFFLNHLDADKAIDIIRGRRRK